MSVTTLLTNIRVCTEILFAGGRLFKTGVEQILKGPWGELVLSIIVVFTKLDVLRDHQEVKLNEELEEYGEDLDDDEFDTKIDTLVDQEMRDRCIVPLCTVLKSDLPKYPWVATSTSANPSFGGTLLVLACTSCTFWAMYVLVHSSL
ncbi:hypothetical protein K438DRAFT_1759794 [Mycena galopus ATCC 62051]|nr:hypothetical protein K438DRAFT_1759794 [Mycena galopus ATCC 62051]